MANTNPFLAAHYEKTALTQQTAKRIQLIYKQSARDIEKQLRQLRMLTPSDSLKKVYLENLLKDINKSSDSFNRTIQNTVLNAGEKSGSIAVEAGNKAMQGAGLTVKGAYSYVPRQQIELIASGKLYGDKWSLSQAIWKNGLRTKSDIQTVVSKGLAQNKPIKDIADDITKYVDPTARKPWDWSKVYPGTAQQVDYNAQRLARTMIQHSYQTSMVQSQLYNPFCKGIVWHSVGIHGRTCELCMERDGNVFPLKDLPLDHPNGLCYFEPALDSMDDIADRLANWAGGGVDSALDEYVTKGLGLALNSPAAKVATNRIKSETLGKSFIQKRLGKTRGTKTAMRSRVAKQQYIDKNLTHLRGQILHHGKQPKVALKNWEKVNARLLQLNEQQLKLLSRAEERFTIVTKGDAANFDYITEILHLPLNKIIKNGDWDTFFHELGHVIDYGSYTYKSRINGSLKFAFRSERDKAYNQTLFSYLEEDYQKLLDANGKLLPHVKAELGGNIDLTIGVQDIISGLSGDANRVWWGHSSTYWGRVGSSFHRGQVNSEAAANMYAAWVDAKTDKFMKKYFPKAYRYWKQEMLKSL